MKNDQQPSINNRERLIKKSGIRNIFTPGTPVQSIDLFFGRRHILERIIQQINTPGVHTLVYGAKGVGKSSLVNVVKKILMKENFPGRIYTKDCDSNNSFFSILAEPLSDLGLDIEYESRTESQIEIRKAGVKIPIAEGGIGKEKVIANTYRKREITPSLVAEMLKDIPGILCIDNVERILTQHDRIALAETVNQLSNKNSPFKLLIAGIAHVAEEITRSEESLQRCLKEIELPRMADDEIRQIVVEGAEKVKLVFESFATESIVKMSSGYPYFAHLLALKCAEEAICSGDRLINIDIMQRAIHKAVQEAEGPLRREYNNAIRSRNINSLNMYRVILLAASSLREDEFSAALLREAIIGLTGVALSRRRFYSYMKRLVSDDYSAILHRCSMGVYRFKDPRMPGFIQLKEMEGSDLDNSGLVVLAERRHIEEKRPKYSEKIYPTREFPGPAGFDKIMEWARYTTDEEIDRELTILQDLKKVLLGASPRYTLYQLMKRYAALKRLAGITEHPKALHLLVRARALLESSRLDIKYGGDSTQIQQALNNASDILGEVSEIMRRNA